MDIVEAWLVDHGLKLIRRRAMFEIEGSELDIRKPLCRRARYDRADVAAGPLPGKSNPVLAGADWERGLMSTPAFNLETLEFEACSSLVKKTRRNVTFQF